MTFFSPLEIRRKICEKTFSFCRTLELCVLGPWAYLFLTSRGSVLGKSIPGLGFFVPLALSLLSSTSPLVPNNRTDRRPICFWRTPFSKGKINANTEDFFWRLLVFAPISPFKNGDLQKRSAVFALILLFKNGIFKKKKSSVSRVDGNWTQVRTERYRFWLVWS